MDEISEDVKKRIEELKEKYEAQGQDFKAYLEGLLYQKYTSYWDYVSVDTLLTLQKPRTDIPDEMIFIIYHQITELYFKLVLHEMQQISTNAKTITIEKFAEHLRRINAYFINLTNSFFIMIDGMEVEQFLKFRMSLLPASGFQSAQYRTIEICATDFIRLVEKSKRDELAEKSIDEKYKQIYWQAGATDLATGKKTLTLTQFEQKYSEQLLRIAIENKDCTLWAVYKSLSIEAQKDEKLIAELRNFDKNVNVNWPLVHYKSAVRYLQKATTDVAATGGTNWQKYLPPRMQLRVFYPELWSNEELENWGKSND